MSETKAAATFDLIYVDGPEGRTMSCAIIHGDDARLVGPFPAKEAASPIVDALASYAGLGFANRDQASRAYTMAHIVNMARGENNAGQSYPYRVDP